MAHVATITIDATKVAADLTDRDIYVDLSELGASFWNTVVNGGGDIRCYKSDGTTELPREVVSCVTASSTGELYILYDGTLSSSTDTDIQIHADGTSSDYASTDTYGSEAVWSNFSFVSHDGGITDSTGNHTSTDSGTTTVAAAKLGAGRSFDGVSDYITIPDSDDFTMVVNDLTVSFWRKIEANAITGADYFMAKGRASNWEWGIRTNSANTAVQQTGWQLNGNFHCTSTETISITDVENDEWQHLTYSFDDLTEYVSYRDGVWVSNRTSYAGVSGNGSDPVYIGKRSLGAPIKMEIDEVRIENVIRDGDTVATEFNNQNSSGTFYSVTNIETTAIIQAVWFM